MIPLDAKVTGILHKTETGEFIPPDEYVVFRAHDKCFLETLLFYKAQCVLEGAEEEQLNAVDRLIQRVIDWQKAHPDRMKIPDAKPGECH